MFNTGIFFKKKQRAIVRFSSILPKVKNSNKYSKKPKSNIIDITITGYKFLS